MNNKEKCILLIIPYFGKFPNYFELYLFSIKNNSTIDFLFITDDHTKYNYPSNAKVVYKTFDEVRNMFKRTFNLKVDIASPYKLCDYRPFYNCVFKKYTLGYDYVGWCDVDVIFGDIRKFISKIDLDSYSKFFDSGSFSFIRNNDMIANLLVNAPISPYYYSISDCIALKDKTIHYDEYNGINRVLFENNYDRFTDFDAFADVFFLKDDFYLTNAFFEAGNEKWVFKYENGTLIGINEDGLEKEFMYVHLQKRKMEYNGLLDNYYIVPNKFIKNWDYKFDQKNIKSVKEKDNKNDFYYSKDYLLNYINDNFELFIDDISKKM